MKEEENKARYQKEIGSLSDRLGQLNADLAKKGSARTDYDRTIEETEGAFMKILESSQTLLHVLKRESKNLKKKQECKFMFLLSCS